VSGAVGLVVVDDEEPIAVGGDLGDDVGKVL
jgi:hypothetical protein